MTLHAALVPAFWDDERIYSLLPETRLLAAYLITCADAVRVPGLIRKSPRSIADDIHLPDDTVQHSLAALEGAAFCELDPANRMVRIPKAPRYCLRGATQGVVRSIFRHWTQLPQSQLRDDHVESIRAALDMSRPGMDDVWSQTFGSVRLNTQTLASPSQKKGVSVSDSDRVCVSDGDSECVSGHVAVRTGWFALFAQHNHGAKPSWGGMHGKLLNELLASHTPDEVLRRADIMFRSPPVYPRGPNPDLKTLYAHFDRFAVEISDTRNGGMSAREIFDFAQQLGDDDK